MLILAFESSARAASAALLKDGKLLSQYTQCSGLTHSRTLLPMGEDMLKNAELTLGDVDLLAVAHGPGSFTGIRIGVSMVKGLAWALDKPCVGVSTLEAMAWHGLSAGGLICPVMDARRSQVYNALFSVENGRPVRLTEDRPISLDDLAQELGSYDWPAFLVGDGAEICGCRAPGAWPWRPGTRSPARRTACCRCICACPRRSGSGWSAWSGRPRRKKNRSTRRAGDSRRAAGALSRRRWEITVASPGQTCYTRKEKRTPLKKIKEKLNMSKVCVFDHPLIQHKLSILRDKRTSVKEFRELVSEIAMLMCYEATRDLPLKEVEVETPVAVAKCKRISGKKLAVVPILRAGLGMVDGMVSMMPNVKVGHVGLFRDPQTLEPVKYYFKMPPDIQERDAIVVDPMLATGGSASAAVTFLKEAGVQHIKLMSIIGAPEGVKKMQEDHPDVDIYVAALDDHLNEHGYIVPGLGDAGDRIFGTK